MKKALLFASSVLLFGACTEKGFDVVPRVEGGDTTFLAAVESQQARVVMVEEFTGVTCPNCPTGHAIVAQQQTQYPGRVLAVSYYPYGIGQARPVEGHSRDTLAFRTNDATDIGSSIFSGVSGLPCASIDRVPVGGLYLPNFNVWPGAISTRLAVPSQANITVRSEWQEGDRTAIIRVRVAYTAAVSKKQALTVLLLEDSLIDAQEISDTAGTKVIPDYNFKHVLRDALTTPSGEVMLSDFQTKEPGRVYERTFVYQVSDKWKADNCKLIAFVHNAESGDKEVLQAAEAKLIE